MIFRSIFLFFLISKPRFVRSEQNCLAVCVAFAEIPAELLKDIFTVPKNVPTICYYEILGIITSPSDEFFDKDTLFFVAWHPFLVENEYQRRISFFSYSRTKEEYTLEARYLMFGLETLPKDYDWKTCNVHRQAFYVIAIKNTTLYYMHCPLKTMIYFKALYCDPYTVDLTKNGLVPDSWNITQINRTDFNAYPLNNETLILNLDPMNLWKWDIKNGKVENCSCRDVPFTLWTIGNWFDGEKINERECKPSWNGSFNNMVDYEKDHPFADENGLVRDIVAQIPTCSFVGDCKPHCRETDPWYDPLIVPILGFPLLSLFILTSIAYFISCVVILRVCASSTHIFRKKKKATVNSNVHE